MRSIFRVGERCRRIDLPPPEISSLRYEISTSPQGGGKIPALLHLVRVARRLAALAAHDAVECREIGA